MSNIDKQALREAAEKAIAAITRLNYEPGINPNDVKTIKEFHEMAHPECALALLDELEAAETRIAELEDPEWTGEVSNEELSSALKVHRLKVDGHSQLSDAFRAGFKYARRAAAGKGE